MRARTHDFERVNDDHRYEKGIPGKTQDVLEFASAYVKEGLTSVWGNTPNPRNYTTFNARTFLQPQLNKAARKDELVAKVRNIYTVFVFFVLLFNDDY